ncbi:bacteriophage Rz lysis family protein [Enterobacter cloacae S611]|uniref:Bacteriophage Rz lysis family protein n=1 Tax=Enterobacter cloacae S611 TaxID=1399146 RepID=A0ABN0Q7Z4_ENTCL|nr:bacteriophage Rz lysis family protein [Enterobacter cloacae S611]
MISSWKAAAALLLLAGVLSIAWMINHYRKNAITFKDQRDKATHNLTLANDTIADMKVRQREVAALDAKYTQELADAKVENAALQRKLDNGGRMLVKGNCPVPTSIETASASGMGNDATVELSSVAGRNVLGIREGILREQASLNILQKDILEQCR